MPVRAIPSANKTLCQTTTNTLDNTCQEEFSWWCFQRVFTASRGSTSLLYDIFARTFVIKVVTSALSSLSSEQCYCKTHLLYDDIAGQKERDCDPDDEENIVPPLLGAPAHELLVVDAEEEADGEEGEEAAVEHLGHEDHHEAVNWKGRKVQIEVFSTITATPF